MPSSPQNSRASRPGFIVFMVLLNLMVAADLGLDAPLIVKITARYGLTDFDFSLFILDPFLGLYILFMFVWGYASDRASRRQILFFTILLGNLFILGTGLALYWRWPFWAMAGCRVLSALGLAGSVPVSSSMVVDVVPPEERAGAFAWMGIAGLLGAGAGFLLSGLLAGIGVFVPYLIGAGLGLGLALGVLFLRDPPRGQTEQALAELIAQGKLDYAYRISGRQVLELARRPGNLYLFGFAFLYNLPGAALGSFFITFLIRNHGFQEGPAAIFTCLVFGTEVFGQLYFGRLGDRRYRRFPHGRLQVMFWTTLAGLPLLAAGFLIPFSTHEFSRIALFSLLVMLGSAVMIGANPNRMATVCDLNLPEHRGTIIGLNTIAGTLATLVAAPTCTFLALRLSGSYAHAFLILFLGFIPAALLLVPLRRRLPSDLAATAATLSARAASRLTPP